MVVAPLSTLIVHVLVKRDARNDDLLRMSDFANPIARLCWTRKNGYCWDESCALPRLKDGTRRYRSGRERTLPARV